MHRLHKFFYLWFSFVHTNVCESHLVSAVLGLGGIKQKRNREWKCWLGKRSGFVGFGWLLTVCILSPCNESSRRSSEATLRQFVDWPGFSWCFFRFFCFCPRRLRRLWCVRRQAGMVSELFCVWSASSAVALFCKPSLCVTNRSRPFSYQDARRCRRFLQSDRVPHYEKTLRSKTLPPTKSKAARHRPFSRFVHDDIPRAGKGSRRRRRNTLQRVTSLIEAWMSFLAWVFVRLHNGSAAVSIQSKYTPQ